MTQGPTAVPTCGQVREVYTLASKPVASSQQGFQQKHDT